MRVRSTVTGVSGRRNHGAPEQPAAGVWGSRPSARRSISRAIALAAVVAAFFAVFASSALAAEPAVTEAATGVTSTSATLHGTAFPEGEAVTSCLFEYGTDLTYGSTIPCEQTVPTDGIGHQVSAVLTGLQPGNTTYHFRLVVVRTATSGDGSDETFTTHQPVFTEAATEVKQQTAVLNGTYLSEGEAVTGCAFEYGLDPNYNATSFTATAPCEPAVPSGNDHYSVSASISGLKANNAVYGFRLVIERGGKTIKGGIEHFNTASTVATGQARPTSTTTANLRGTVDPAGEEVMECLFEWGEEQTYGNTAPCSQTPAQIGAGIAPVEVSAPIGPLTPGSLYHFRLTIRTGEGTIVQGFDRQLLMDVPQVESQRTDAVGIGEATLEAQLRGEGNEVEFYFEYGVDESYGNVTPGGFVSGEGSAESVREEITGLQPGTTYHWRAVMTNALGTTKGADKTFTTFNNLTAPDTSCGNQVFRNGPGERLGDCRAFEQASPQNKNGAAVQHTINIIQASANGDRITFAANAIPTAGGGSGGDFVARRSGSGWTTTSLLATLGLGESGELLGWDGEVKTSVTAGYQGIHVGSTETGDYPLVVPDHLDRSVRLAGFANDSSHMLFESQAVLASGGVAGVSNAYDLHNGTVSLVGRIPAGSATSCNDAAGNACVPASEGSMVGPYNWQRREGGPLEYGGASGGYYEDAAISNDGSRIVFTSRGAGQLYLRENDTVTKHVSASKRGTPDPNGPRPAAFLTATPDGSKIFFESCEKLTADSTAVSTASGGCNETEQSGSDSNLQGNDLYEFDSETEQLSDLTVDQNSGDPLGAEVLGVLGVSSDGSDLYFVANGVLAQGASRGNCHGYEVSAGECNLYLLHNGVPTFVARLSGSDAADWIASTGNNGSQVWKRARVSANGVAMFGSTQSLDGYDNLCQNGQGFSNCSELYRYAPGDPQPNCVSCSPNGANPAGPALLQSIGNAFGSDISSTILTRNLSADGSRVFFDSPDRLVAEDTDNVTDPYEWEANGTGSCRSDSQDGGCLYLLSTGKSSEPSFFADASESGNDAYLFTVEQLVPADTDHVVDVYDTRVGGGLQSQHEAGAAVPCSSEACKGAALVAPSEASPGSSTFNGPGNHKSGEKNKHCKKKHAKSCKKHQKHKHKKRHGKKHGGGNQKPSNNGKRGGQR